MLSRQFQLSSKTLSRTFPVYHPLPKLRLLSAAAMPSPPQLQHVSITLDSSSIALIKFNRPKQANALNVPVVQDVLSALQWAEREDAVRTMVTTGEGKFYTAGLDLLDEGNQQPGATICDEFIEILGKIHELLIGTDKLVISAVNGPAPGWGTTSIALSDLVYAAPDAIFFTPFVQWGLCAEGCSSLTFARIMGRQKASALILAGERMTAAELQTAGLITKVLPKENFLDDVMNIARRIARLPTKSLKINKSLMMRTTRSELLETNRIELNLLREQVRKRESLDAIAGFKAETERRRKANL